MNDSILPPLSSEGHTLIVTAHYPPGTGGSSVIMHNLLSRFNTNSYTVATTRRYFKKKIDNNYKVNINYVFKSIGLFNRIDKIMERRHSRKIISKLMGLTSHLKPKLIVGVYPDFNFLVAAYETSRRLKIPLLVYLHDTLSEGLAGTRWESRAKQLQEKIFTNASSILVMSEGMVNLFKKKYDMTCKPLSHSYLEPIPKVLPTGNTLPRQALWSGEVYSINANAVRRVSDSLHRISCPLLILTSDSKKRTLRKLGIYGPHIKISFYSRRVDYLNVLKNQGILVLALDWPDESRIHEDELATIFPTKTPEYLAAGCPILVHCPEHYFLAKFFRENGCGLVVSDRSIDALSEACLHLLEDSNYVRKIRRSAISVAKIFAADRVSALFQMEVNKLIC